jgi:glycosyltransferase involved in cell wall biosynthesis
LKIAVVHDLPPAGGQYRVLAEVVPRLRGHELVMVTRRPAEAGQIGLERDLPIQRLPPLPKPSGPREQRALLRDLPRWGAELAAAVDATGADVALCFDTEGIQAPEVMPPLRMPSVYHAAEPERQFVEPFPDFGRPTGLAFELYRRGHGPTVRLARKRYRENITAASRIVTHSHHTAGQLREHYGVDPTVVHLAVDAQRFSPADVERERSVLSIGTLHPYKGHQFVIDALGSLPEPRPRLDLVAAWGSLGPALQRLAAERGVELNLRSGLSEAELLDAYRRTGVLACGHFREPFGLIVLEGMATATPIVAVAEGGFRETVRDGVDGLLTPRDRAAFAAGIVAVLDDRDLATRLGSAGRVAALDRWTWDRAAAGYEQVLREAAAGGKER